MRFPYFRYAASLIVAAGIFAGCGGGGKSLVPGGSSQQSLGQSVPVTFTVTIGSQSQTQSTKRNPQFIPTNTQSIVIDYIGDNPNATPAPNATPPANVTTAATVNVTATTTNPPPAGQCFANNGNYTCTISLKLPVGIIDLYVLAYAGQNGTGLLLSGAAVIVQVNANGTVTQPGSTTPISIALVQKGVQVGTATIGSNATIVPNGVSKPSVAAPSYPTNSAPYVYSAAQTVAVSNPSGTPIPAGTPISSITITDNETGGASCLVYIPNGATTATPCPFATSASSVTLSTSGDSYALLYNGKFAPAGSISITGAVAGGVTPTPITVSITPTVFTVGPAQTFSGYGVPIGALAYDSVGSALYIGIGSASAPLYKSNYSPSTGYASPAPVAVSTVNGVSRPLSATGAPEVSGGPAAMVIGPDNNLWFVEDNGEASTPYVAVAVINSAAVNPAGGAAIQPGAGVFAEYTLAAALGTRGSASPPLKTIASLGGFIWVMDKRGDFYRINPTTGLVSPNLATGYGAGTTPSTPTNAANPITDPTGVTQISSGAMTYDPMIVLGSSLYVPNGVSAGSVDLLALDTSATPTTGICSPAGGSPCIATFTAPFTGLTYPEDGATTDGTSIYAISDGPGSVYKLTPPSTVASSTGAFTGTWEGGLGLTKDGWFWTLTSTGVEALEGMASATTLTANNASCPTNRWLGRGANGFLVGPDGTLLFSPNLTRVSGPTVAPLCAVVY